jgi:hypothetical protein
MTGIGNSKNVEFGLDGTLRTHLGIQMTSDSNPKMGSASLQYFVTATDRK